MSSLKVTKLQGIIQTNNEITIPSNHRLIVSGTLRAASIQSSGGVSIWSPDPSGNISMAGNLNVTGSIGCGSLSASSRINLPIWTTATRPTTNLIVGRIGYNTTLSDIDIWNGTSWADITNTPTVGTQSNPATSGMVIRNANLPSGLYWIRPSGQTSYQMYVDNDRNGGGWVLCANVRTATCQDHMDNNPVRISGTTGPRIEDTSTTKMADGWMNALRSSSTYTGSTSYWLEALNFNKNMFISSAATVDLLNSASNQDARTNVTLTYEGALNNRDPNTGTRGFGDHHTSGGTFFAWGRHPEFGGQCGFREDSLGASNGYLWIK
jgi:hypothetical protein